MRRFIMITNKQKLIILAISVLFIILSAICISILEFPKATNTDAAVKSQTQPNPQNENKRMKEILSSIVPAENKTLFEDGFRNMSKSPQKTSIDIAMPVDIRESGNPVSYITIYSDEDYMRPIYVNSWKQAYYRGWLYLPKKIIDARHILFAYNGTSGDIFDIEGGLGFYPNVSIDNESYLNFLIYNFDLQGAVRFNNQIVFTGKPVKKGVQIIAVKKEDFKEYGQRYDNIAVQLCTPAGYEIDYQNVQTGKKKDVAEDYGPDDDAVSILPKSSTGLSKQNMLLRQELTHYISDSSQEIYFQQNGYQTSNVLDTNIDLEEAFTYSKNIEHKVLYSNLQYISPVYHPDWNKHYDMDWCYIPRKIYINMKKLFVLPSDSNLADDLYGELGFFEKSPTIDKKNVGLFIKNFSVASMNLFDDNILVTGTPCRTGAQIISLPKASLVKNKDYAVRLVTKDHYELDADVLKN